MTTVTGPRTLTIELPEYFLLRRLRVLSIPSANAFVAWNRARAYYRFTELKRLYCLHILAAKQGARWGPPAERVRIEVVRRCCRVFDERNFQGGLKYFEDSLVKMGVVVDDSPEHVVLVARQEKAPVGARRVLVMISEALSMRPTGSL